MKHANRERDELNHSEEENEAPAPSTPAPSKSTRKRKYKDETHHTPAQKNPKIVTPKAPRKSSKENKKIGINGIQKKEDFDPEPFLSGKNQSPPNISLSALIKYYFIAVAEHDRASIDDIFNWLIKMKYYADLDPSTLRRQKMAKALASNTKIFESVDRGVYRLIGSGKPAPPEDELPMRDEENREWNEEENKKKYKVVWNDGKNTFDLEGYRFQLAKKNGDKYQYGKCVSCHALRTRMEYYEWKLNGEDYPQPTVCMLKFVEKDTVVRCPWKPNGAEHFCLKRRQLDLAIRKHDAEERMAKGEEKLQELIKLMEDKIEKAAGAHDRKHFSQKLKDLLAGHEMIHPFVHGERKNFLYFIFKSKELKYVGMSCNYDRRSEFHPRGDYAELFEDADDIEFVIAPLGRQNEMMIADLEACYIRSIKEGKLGPEFAILNKDDGNFRSEDDILLSNPNLIDALKDLLQCTKEDGLRVKLTGSSEGALISIQKRRNSNNKITLERMQSPPPPPQQSSQSSGSSQESSSASQSIIPSHMEELRIFFEKNALLHPYKAGQKKCYFYMMTRPGSKNVLRYGISETPDQRKIRHDDSFEDKFDFYVTPIGDQNYCFVKDLEACCIRLARKKIGKFSKENKNKDGDHGIFSSDYAIWEDAVENLVHPQHKSIVKAIEQLTKLTVKNKNLVV